jgi:hypothetical protein
MVARAYSDLGGIGGEQNNIQQDYSPRGKDLDRIQTFVFECDPADPLTALLHLQASNDAPLEGRIQGGRTGQKPDASGLRWVDLLSIDVDDEGGVFFIETHVEVAQVRLVCKTGNYTSGKLRSCRTMR